MEVKNFVEFSVMNNGRLYTFNVPADGNLGEAYDAAYQVLDEITRRIQEIAKQRAPQEVPSDKN